MVETVENPKLASLREKMEREGLDAYVCFHADAHNSEYIAKCDERIAFISGFEGSNGVAVITKNDARCWTDSRYYLAIQKELQQGWSMMKMDRTSPTWFDWLASVLTEGAKVGWDFTQYPYSSANTRKGFLR